MKTGNHTTVAVESLYVRVCWKSVCASHERREKRVERHVQSALEYRRCWKRMFQNQRRKHQTRNVKHMKELWICVSRERNNFENPTHKETNIEDVHAHMRMHKNEEGGH